MDLGVEPFVLYCPGTALTFSVKAVGNGSSWQQESKGIEMKQAKTKANVQTPFGVPSLVLGSRVQKRQGE